MLMLTMTEYFWQLSEDFEEPAGYLFKNLNARLLVQGNYDICIAKTWDWFAKEVAEVASIYALLRPHNSSYTIYFLSVLIGQFSEAFFEKNIYDVIKDVNIVNVMKKHGMSSEYIEARSALNINWDELNSSVFRDRIPNPPIVYFPWYFHFAIMTYCLSYIDKRRIIEEIVRIRQSIYAVIFNFLALGHWMIIGSTCRILRIGCQAMKTFLSLCLLPIIKIKDVINIIRKVKLKITLEDEDFEEPPTEEIPNKTEEVNMKNVENHQTKLEHFECPVCMEVMETPLQIFSCTKDHFICSDCLKSSTITACPLCREDFRKFVPKRRPKMEELLILFLSLVDK